MLHLNQRAINSSNASAIDQISTISVRLASFGACIKQQCQRYALILPASIPRVLPVDVWPGTTDQANSWDWLDLEAATGAIPCFALAFASRSNGGDPNSEGVVTESSDPRVLECIEAVSRVLSVNLLQGPLSATLGSSNWTLSLWLLVFPPPDGPNSATDTLILLLGTSSSLEHLKG
jgi:hypothetical protein